MSKFVMLVFLLLPTLFAAGAIPRQGSDPLEASAQFQTAPSSDRIEIVPGNEFNGLANFIDQRVWKTESWSSTDTDAGVHVQGIRIYMQPFYLDGLCRSQSIWISYPESVDGPHLRYSIHPSALGSDIPEEACTSDASVDDFFVIVQGHFWGEPIKDVLDGFREALENSREQLSKLRSSDDVTVLPRDCVINLTQKLMRLDMTIENVDHATNAVRYTIPGATITIPKAIITTHSLCEGAAGDYIGIGFEVDYSGDTPRISETHLAVE